MTPLPAPSLALWLGFVGLSIAVAALVISAIERTSGKATGRRAALAFGGWMLLTAGLAASGFLAHFDPPRIPLVMAGIIAWLVWTARADWAGRLSELPLRVLVGFQAFRIVVEILIHTAADEGIAPYELTWEGLNLDIITGVSAALLAAVADRVPPVVLHAWNLVTAGILGVVLLTAFATMPGPTNVMPSTPPNVWITTFPFIWLPAVLVLSAFACHIVLARRLLSDARTRGASAG